MSAALEYLCAEILDIAEGEARQAERQRINPRHLMLAIRKDADLDVLLKTVTISEAGVLPTVSVPKSKILEESQPPIEEENE